jgi:hypothetical protein
VHLNGQAQFYQRDQEQKRDGKWVAVPFFVLEKREAVTMGEAQARSLVDKIRSLGWRGEIWIEVHDGRRIDVNQPVQESGEDDRTPVAATLDDSNWYVIKPICRPEGRKFFLSIPVPGFPTNVVIYSDDPLGVLRRAEDLNYLQFAETYQWPEPQQTNQNSRGYRLRPRR